MMADAPEIKNLVIHVAETEHKYLPQAGQGNRYDPVFTPWMPYQPADFIGIIWECMPEIEGNLFLDVGCGPGTKIAIAKTLFGLEAAGIEIDPDMARAAQAEGEIWEGDALAIKDAPALYAHADIVWLYRPFRDAKREAALESLITSNMKRGAVLAGGSWENAPPKGWVTIVDDVSYSPLGQRGPWRGAWQKP
jgi:SAM-dependent methyltransferase